MPTSLSLDQPRVELIESYREHVREFEDAGEDLVPFPLSFDHRDGVALVERLEQASRGEGLPEGIVPHSTYWLVLDGTTGGWGFQSSS